MSREAEGGLHVLGTLLNEGLASCGWRARFASRGMRESHWRAWAVVNGDSLHFSAEDTGLLDQCAWSYHELGSISVVHSRLVAYADAVSEIVALSHRSVFLPDEVPSPFLLVLPHLVTTADFVRERQNRDLETRAVSILRSIHECRRALNHPFKS